MLSFATQTITRERAEHDDDGHGNSTANWAGALSTLVIGGCSVQPGASDEDRVNRDGVQIQFTVFAPAGVDVLASDRVDFEGSKYRVVGEPDRWGTGILDHTRILLSRWEG